MNRIPTVGRAWTGISCHFKRNYGITCVLYQKAATDPIQKLFVDKIREYKNKSVGGKLVDSTPKLEKDMANEMEKIERQYGGGAGVDLTKFPNVTFKEVKIDPINAAQVEKK
uniref:ATP synthase-coupling factor 6, mitochondrial n=1 Tax=Strigamia maritima TaxID=126957 RepID=T1J6P0_STRMM